MGFRSSTKGGLNVRQTEKLVKTLMSHGLETPAPEKKASAEVDYAAEGKPSASSMGFRSSRCRFSIMASSMAF